MQQILGRTKLLYFGPSRVQVSSPSLEYHAALADGPPIIMETPFEAPPRAKAAVAVLRGVDDCGRQWFQFVLLDKPQDDWGPHDTIGFHEVGIVDIFDDGTAARAEKLGPPEVAAAETSRRGSFLRRSWHR